MATGAQRDWKVTTSYRILVRIGWATIAVAVYFATAAAVLDSIGVWWIVAGLSIGVMLLMAILPEPVPREMIVGPRNWIDSRQQS